MLTHENIWYALDRLASNFGFSPSGLAKQSGLDSTSFNKSKRIGPDGKPRWPSTESIARVLNATGATLPDFIALLEENYESDHVSRMPHPIPMIGFGKAGSEGYFDENGYPAGSGWDEIHFPDFTSGEGSGTYALEVKGTSMAPLYRRGDIVIVSPDARLRKNDRVVVKTTEGEVMIKELLQKGEKKIELGSLNPKHEDRVIAMKDVAWIARILWVSQ